MMVTLVCCYVACWGPTKTRGVDDVQQAFDATYSKLRLAKSRHVVAPLIVSADGVHLRSPIPVLSRNYYFWFFGYVAKLPYEREVDWQPEEDLSDFPQTLDGDYIGH